MNAFGTYRLGFTLTPWVKRLLIINAAAFFLLMLPGLREIFPYLALRPNFLLHHPWTPLTYMFLHVGLWHLLINLLILFFFGSPLESHWGSREFIRYYLVCGLGGALFSLVFAWNAAVVGASAAILGLMLAFALNWPNAPIYVLGIFPIKAKWLVAFLVFINLFSAATGVSDGVAYFAHLGGLACGYLYLKLDVVFRTRLSGLKRKLAGSGVSVVTSPKAKNQSGHRIRRHQQQDEQLLDEVDRVLDKISTSGLGSLSSEERKLLDEVSRRYRKD